MTSRGNRRPQHRGRATSRPCSVEAAHKLYRPRSPKMMHGFHMVTVQSRPPKHERILFIESSFFSHPVRHEAAGHEEMSTADEGRFSRALLSILNKCSNTLNAPKRSFEWHSYQKQSMCDDFAGSDPISSKGARNGLRSEFFIVLNRKLSQLHKDQSRGI